MFEAIIPRINVVGEGGFDISASKWCSRCCILRGLSSGNSGETGAYDSVPPFVDEVLH